MSALAEASVLTLGRTGDFWTKVDDSQQALLHTLTQLSAAGQGLFDTSAAMLRDFTGLPRPCAGWRSFKFLPQEVIALPAQVYKTVDGRSVPDDEALPALPDFQDNLPFPVSGLPGFDVGVAAWLLRYPQEYVPRVVESAVGPLIQGIDFILHADWLLFRQDPLILFPACHVTVSAARDTSRGRLSALLRLDVPGSEFSSVACYRFRNHSKRSFFEASCEAAGVGVSRHTGVVQESATLPGGAVHRLVDGTLVETRADGEALSVSAGNVPGGDLALLGDVAVPSSVLHFPLGRLMGGRWASVEVATGEIEATVWELDVGYPQIRIPFVRRDEDGATSALASPDTDALNAALSASLTAAGYDDLWDFLTGENLIDAGYVDQDPITFDLVGGLCGKGLLGKIVGVTSVYASSDVRSIRLKSYVDRECPVGLPSVILAL